MIREKPSFNRKRALAEEACRTRTVEQLLRMADLLGPDEELASPARVGDQIIVPIIRKRMPLMRYIDVVERIASKMLAE